MSRETSRFVLRSKERKYTSLPHLLSPRSAVNEPMKRALEEARRDRTEGRTDEAERAYARVAELARSQDDPLTLAHALRHISDLSRQRGALPQAWEHANEAVELYRKSGDRLGLANAIRLAALSAAAPGLAKRCWREARNLYSSLGVIAGVKECDSHLGN